MLQVDNSTLRAVAACHTQALLRYHWGYEAPLSRPEMAAGKAWHAALEAYFSKRSGADASAIFAREYGPTAATIDPSGPQARLGATNLSIIVDEWFRRHPIATFPLKVSAVEQPFRVRLTDDIELVGIFDGLGTDAAGRPWVLEHKSTGRLTEDWWDQFHLDSQLSGYVWAARELQHELHHPFDEEVPSPIVGAYVNAIQFSKLPSDPVRKCAAHGVKYAECGVLHMESAIRPITRTAEQLEQWKNTAIKLALAWKNMTAWAEAFPHLNPSGSADLEGQFNGSCRFCQFSPYCRMGRPEAYLKANYVISPWRPLERGHR